MKADQFEIPNLESELGDTPSMTVLSQIVRNARKKKGWTLEEIGQRAGTVHSTLSKIGNNFAGPNFEIIR